ncbi:MAG TPA: hypothetical protein ENN67_03220 [Firmicutes bacterium]|nr:hypothetical protein [Bacillota bacterium]
MKKSKSFFNKPAFLIVFAITVCVLAGCGKPGVGTPGYNDPFEDKSPFRPAPEYEYLADLDLVKQAMMEGASELERSAGQLQGADIPDMDMTAVFASLGFDQLERKELSAEANESLIHAHSAYGFPSRGISLLTGMKEVGSAEVKLPAHFPRERLAGSMFFAKPGEMVEWSFENIEKTLNSAAGSIPGGGQMTGSVSMDSIMQFMGFENASKIYDWMGDECVFFSLSNPDFDPQGEMTAENTAFFSLMAISSDSPVKGIEVVQQMVMFPLVMMGMSDIVKRDKIGDYDSLIINPPSSSKLSRLGIFSEDNLKKMEDELQKLPPLVITAVEGYLFIGDKPSVETAIGIYNPESATTGRNATMEMEANWDLFMESLLSKNPGVWMGLVESLAPEVREVFDKLFVAVSDINELGVSRLSVKVEGNTLHIDTWISKESVRLFETIGEALNEVPGKTWESIGRSLGEMLGSQRSPGGQDFSFDFEE